MTRISCLVLLLLSTLLLACGGSSKKPTAGDPNAIVADAATAVKGVQSFHFTLNHENGGTAIPLGLSLISADGDVVVPDKLSADIKAKAASLTASVKVIGIADQTWITNPFTRKWQLLPDTTLGQIANPAALVGALVSNLKDVQLKGQESVDGTNTYHLTGTMASDVLQVAIPTAETGRTVNIDLWVGVSDSLPRRARISGPLAASEADNIARQVDFSAFNTKIDIQPPPTE